ncbi:tripartite tricarboxylate transporter family receptor [Clostridium homopropionicum DSM 5847]|uniref:Tripartite tricarboxylate transporter family receptor n=1 Tax=Clostridium homopropionicum DSM 5847 TaxID=1121318 RepID=A0A0L6Z652_9CLOT|nr:tripartite tricarboxylate transporter substrate binding protein [Clostridium homopropionicum]KOA18445.1 tripartite tricarboxylate transporter family receptor [Clostridium homopropionicum DSM 5847]SFF66683.1 Tripartite-type tricarboxylate transporter, receptor component TctC [Clostridium homopropionicum]
MKNKVIKLIAMGISLAVMTGAFIGCSKNQAAKNNNSGAESKTSSSNWPTKPIQIIVPFNAGGDTDFHARTYAKYLEPILGQSVVVVNVNGSNGSAGTIQVRDSKPDGYTALFFHDSMLMNKVVGVTDFAHEALDVAATGIMDNSYILAVNAKSPYKTLDDLVKAAKANPGKLKYASSIGGYTYYVGAQLEKVAGVSFNKVDAGGGSDRNAALLANKIDTNVNPYGVMKPYIDSGDFRVLAVFSEKRSELFPNVPTAIEQGYNIIARRAYFLSFPKGTDASIIEKMSKAMEEVSKKPEYAKDIAKAYAVEPAFLNTKDTKDYLDKAMKEFMDAKSLIMGK